VRDDLLLGAAKSGITEDRVEELVGGRYDVLALIDDFQKPLVS
jgi:hypothetical protein